MKKSYPLIIIFLGILSFPQNGNAQLNLEWSYRGYLKELGSISLNNSLSNYRFDNIIHHRIENRFQFGSDLELRFDLRSRLLSGYTVRYTPHYGKFIGTDPGYVDANYLLINEKEFILHTMIDRLHLSYYLKDWEFHLGRQRINWGKSLVWNPNDLFNAYAYLDFDFEERPSTDAFHTQYSWSYASSIQAGYRFGDSLDESVLAMMYRGNWGEYDIQVLGGNYFDEVMMGFGWSGYLSDAGFLGELSYFRIKDDFWNRQGHITATLGGDYMFENGLYLSTELLYNGGWDKGLDPLARLNQPPSASDLFIAETGYFINTSHLLSPLTNISLGLLGSMSRRILIMIPQVSYSVSEDIDLLILAQLLKGSVFTDATPNPNIIFIRVKWSY